MVQPPSRCRSLAVVGPEVAVQRGLLAEAQLAHLALTSELFSS